MHIDPVGGADWQAQIRQLEGESQIDEARGLRLGLERRERQVQELGRLRTELRRQQRSSAARSGLTKIVSAVAGGILAAASAVVSIYCPPAALGIAAGGAIISASLGIGAAVLDSNALRTKASEMRTDSLIDRAGQERLELLGSLERVAEADRRVGEFVRGWLAADEEIQETAARCGREKK